MQAKRVLVVDDEDDIREVAATTLELTRGWEVRCAASGQAAIASALEWRPDAVLLDVMMPDMDGPTAFEHIRADERTRDIPVILLTAKIQAVDRQRYEALGVQGVIAKPFNPLTLAADMSEILRWG